MIKLKSLITESKVSPKEMAEKVRKAISLVLDIDDDLVVAKGIMTTNEWFDKSYQEWDDELKKYVKRHWYNDGALSTRFIFPIIFHYKTHFYKTHHEFLYYRYPVKSLLKMDRKEREKISNHFHHQYYYQYGKYYADKESNERWPDESVIRGRSPQTVFLAHVIEKDSEVRTFINKYRLDAPLEKQLLDLVYSHSSWDENNIDFLGTAGGDNILELVQDIKRIIDSQDGDDEESIDEPDPTPKKPELVPA